MSRVATIALSSTALAFVLSLGVSSSRASGEEAPPRAAWIPADAVISLDVSRPADALDPLLDPELADRVKGLPGFPVWSQAPGYLQLTAGVAMVEAQLGTDWKTALRKLLGGGLTIAVRPDGSSLLLADATDEALLGKFHEVFVNLTRMDAASKGQEGRVKSDEHRGVTCWSLGPEEFHAIVGGRLILANRSDALREALDLRAGEGRAAAGGRSLDSSPALREGRKALGGRPFAAAHLDLAALKHLPGMQSALEGSKEPFPALLFAGLGEALRASSWLALGLERTAHGIRLEAVADGRTAASFAIPPASEAGAAPECALENLEVPGRIAALSLWRDLHAFYAAKDRLFPERTAGIILFENMMGIFFSGLDLTEEVFGQTEPEVRVVVARQRYDQKTGEPQVQLPAFALLFRMKEPERFGEVMEEAWQKALGLVNFTRGQKAEPGMIIDKEFHGNVKYSFAYFRLPEGAAKEGAQKDLDVRFNFRPAIARAGDTLILSSTDGLARDIIDALGKEGVGNEGGKPASAGMSHSVLEIDGAGLREILAANREGMIANNMVEKGNSRKEAEGEVGLLLDLLRYVKGLEIDAGTRDEKPRATLELHIDSGAGKSIQVRSEGRLDGSPQKARPILAAMSAETSHVR